MITNHKCAQCGCDVIYDDGKNELGIRAMPHPESTKYYKAEGKNIIEYYCGVECGLIRYEEENEKTRTKNRNES